MVEQVRLHHAVYALSNVAWCIENFDPGSNEVIGGLKWIEQALVAAIGVCRFDVSSARARLRRKDRSCLCRLEFTNPAALCVVNVLPLGTLSSKQWMISRNGHRLSGWSQVSEQFMVAFSPPPNSAPWN